VRIEAAALADRPVYFRVASTEQTGRLRSQPSPGRTSGLMDVVALTVFSLLTAAGVVLTRHNLHRGRGDRRGAFRVAGYVLTVSLAASLLLTSREAQLPRWSVVSACVEFSLFWALVVWLFYLALEPFVRQIWPEMLISWNRLLSGRLRDPLVGWHLLVGAAFGVAGRMLWQVNALAPEWFGLGPPDLFSCRRLFFDVPLWPLLGGRYCLGELLGCQLTAVAAALAIVLFLLLLRFLLQRQWLAYAGVVLTSALLYPIGLGDPRVSWITAATAAVIVLVLLARFGLVALVSYEFVRFLLRFPITSDLSAWHAAGATMFPAAVIVGLAVFGYWASRSGRPVLRNGGLWVGLAAGVG
jgi:serine/threonine-protein kinase